MNTLLKAQICALSALACGCTTNPITGKKEILGAIPVPFTGSDTQLSPELTEKALLIEQFAPFQWAALVLIIGGAGLWWWTKGATGAGKACVGLGIGLSVFAVVMPQIAGWLGLIAIIGAVAMCGYYIYGMVKEKSKPQRPILDAP